MAEWYETEQDDIDIDYKTSEVNLYVTYKDFGNIYKTLTFEQVNKLCEEIKKGPKK